MLSVFGRAYTLALAFAVISPALGHNFIVQPPTLGYAGDLGNNILDPLRPNTGDFPCKGYLTKTPPGNLGMTSRATWQAGSQQNVTAKGTLSHGGGSCQLSLSYDQGKSFQVVWSQIGGCLLEWVGQSTSFTLPKDAKSGEVLLSWTWIPYMSGGGEFYQSCIPITIANGGAGLTDEKSYPPMFVANVGTNINGCASNTDGNHVTVYPNPGANVIYGQQKPGANAGFTGTNCVMKGEKAQPSSSVAGSTVPAGAGSTANGASPGAATTLWSGANSPSPSTPPGAGAVNANANIPADGASSPLSDAMATGTSDTLAQPASASAAGPEAATSAQASTVAVAAPGATCKRRKRSTNVPHGGSVLERRHQRLERSTRELEGWKRLAALEAQHNARKREML